MHRRPWTVAVLMAALVVAGTSCRSGGTEQAPAAPAVATETDARLLDQLWEDLALLGLLNRLQLSPEQLAGLLPAVEALQQRRARLEAEMEAGRLPLVEALRQQRELLLRDQPVPTALEQQIQALAAEAEQARAQILLAMGAEAQAVRDLLSAPQVSILSGQYEAELQARELLDWLRGLPDSAYSEEAVANAQGLNDPERGMDESFLLNLFHTARAMDEAGYRQARRELAQRLAPLYGPGEPDALAHLADWFSHPRMAALLQEKREATEEAPPQ